jgi:hypothetical protein
MELVSSPEFSLGIPHPFISERAETRAGLHIKSQLLLPDFDQNWSDRF